MGPIRFGLVALDTPNPRVLAAFYAQLLDWTVDPDAEDDWVTIRSREGQRMAFQLAPT